MRRMLSGEMNTEGIAEVLHYLRRKGETVAELVGFASAMQEMAHPVELQQEDDPVIDTCGTGGDGTNTFNVSTATAFVVAGAGQLDIVKISLVLALASIAGDQSGYFLGRRTGPKIFSRPDSRIFKQEYVTRTQAFYAKHGGKTLIYAKFVPIVRTFAPFMAGVGRMAYSRFVSFNVFGGLGWVLSMSLAGYFLGGVPLVRRNFEKVVLGIVVLSLLPILIQYWHSRRPTEAAR